MKQVPTTRNVKKDRPLSEEAFSRLLVWLDQGSNSEGRKYLEMRRRLVDYFDRKNCATPDDLADETLNRVARRLDEEGITETDVPARYCYTVARFVFMEYLRATNKEELLRNSLAQVRPTANQDGAAGSSSAEHMLSCMEQCIDKLEPAKREIIIGYYNGSERVRIENRRTLAHRLGISTNALSIRACRIRDGLESCVRECMKLK